MPAAAVSLKLPPVADSRHQDQKQDNLKFKAAWDISPNDTLAYTFGRFANDTSSDVESYLRNASGATVYSGSGLNINGYSYTVAASAFSNGVYNFDEEQFSNSLAFNHRSSDGVLDWRIIASAYDYDTSEQRLPTTALPAAYSGGAGAITRGDGTGWKTLDARGVWRPEGAAGTQEISFGAKIATDNGCGTSYGPNWSRMVWSVGITEPGSSGSGLYEESTQMLYGLLTCGTSTCYNPTGWDGFGRWDVALSSGGFANFMTAGSDDAMEPNDTCAAAYALISWVSPSPPWPRQRAV
jgi:hypothetical protein